MLETASKGEEVSRKVPALPVPLPEGLRLKGLFASPSLLEASNGLGYQQLLNTPENWPCYCCRAYVPKFCPTSPEWLAQAGADHSVRSRRHFSIKETWPKPYSFPPLLHACCQQVWLLCQCVCKRQYWITVQTWFVTPAHRLCWGGAQHLFYGYRLNLTTCIVFPALLQCMSNSFTEAHRRNPTVSPSQHLS